MLTIINFSVQIYDQGDDLPLGMPYLKSNISSKMFHSTCES